MFNALQPELKASRLVAVCSCGHCQAIESTVDVWTSSLPPLPLAWPRRCFLQLTSTRI